MENELEWLVFDHLTLSASGTYVDTKFTTNFCGTNGDGSVITQCDPTASQTPAGERLPITPQFKGNFTARYAFNVGDFKSFMQGSVIGQSSTSATANVFQNANFGTIGGFTTADFSAGTGLKNWHVEAYIENAFDRHGELQRFAECGQANCETAYHVYPIKPMNYGIKFGQKF